MTAGSSPSGARGSGRAFRARSMFRSRSMGFMVCHVLPQGFPAPMDVRLDLAQRHAEQRRDLLVALVFVVIEHEGHALVIRQPLEGASQRLLPCRLVEVPARDRRGQRGLETNRLARLRSEEHTSELQSREKL